MTVEENGAPSVGAPVVEGLVDGWVVAGSTVATSGSDQLGLRRLEVVEGGVARSVKDGTCVDWSVRPCAEAPAGTGLSSSVAVSSLGLASGTRELVARATDGAGNVATSATGTTVKVDNDAPVAQLTGGGPSEAARRTASWTAPAGGSPVVSGTLTLCAAAGTRCESSAVSPSGSTTFAIGDWGGDVTATVALTDLVGNVGTSAPQRFQLRVPPAPTATPTTPPTTTPMPPTPTGGPTTNPTPTVAPGPRKTTLRATFPKKLGRATKLSVRGTVTAGAAKRVTLVITGKRPSGKTVRTTSTATPTKRGTWSIRATLPRDLRRSSGLTLTVSASPRSGWATPAPRRKSIR